MGYNEIENTYWLHEISGGFFLSDGQFKASGEFHSSLSLVNDAEPSINSVSGNFKIGLMWMNVSGFERRKKK